MDLENYQPYWEAVNKTIMEKMKQIVEILRESIPSTLSIGDPEIDEGSDEFKVFADITSGDNVVIGLDFKLLDGDENGAEGVGICLSLTGFGGLVMGGYFPSAYTEDAYSLDVCVAEEKVANADPRAIADYILDSALKNDVLLRELAENGISI